MYFICLIGTLKSLHLAISIHSVGQINNKTNVNKLYYTYKHWFIVNYTNDGQEFVF